MHRRTLAPSSSSSSSIAPTSPGWAGGRAVTDGVCEDLDFVLLETENTRDTADGERTGISKVPILAHMELIPMCRCTGNPMLRRKHVWAVQRSLPCSCDVTIAGGLSHTDVLRLTAVLSSRCGEVYCKQCVRYRRRLSYLATPDARGQCSM